MLSDLHGFWREAVDGPETGNEENNGKEEQRVIDHAVDGEQGDNDSIVGGKMPCVVRDSLESLVGALWARDALVIKKLAQRSQRR